MAYLGEEGRKFPGAFKPGTGTITFVCDATAYAAPDQAGYGQKIYVHGGLADKSCPYKLNTKYKVGDRVRFTYVKAMRPERGCEWAGINLEKMQSGGYGYGGGKAVPAVSQHFNSPSTFPTMGRSDSISSLASSTSQKSYADRLICNARGTIDSNGISCASIALDPPFSGRAFMDRRSVDGNFVDDKGVFALGKAFPRSQRVICDLVPQTPRGGCSFLAKNVVVVDAIAKDDRSSTATPISDDLDEELDALQLRSAISNLLQDTTSSAAGVRRDTTMDRDEIEPPPGFTKDGPFGRGAMKNINKQGLNTMKSGSTNKAGSQSSGGKECSNGASADVVDISTQTDTPIEAALLEKIFNDQQVFQQICTRLPDVTYRYMRIRGGGSIADQ